MCVYYCFLVFRRIGEYISLNQFYFVNLTSSCSFIPCTVLLKKHQFFFKVFFLTFCGLSVSENIDSQIFTTSIINAQYPAPPPPPL